MQNEAKLTEPEYGTPDDENPEWTKEDFAKAMTYPNFPPEIMRLIEAEKAKKDKSRKAA